MESRWDALMAMQERLGTDGNPLIDLRCLDSDMAQAMEDRYTEQYMAARDGDEMPHEDRLNALFTTYVSDNAYTPTKGVVHIVAVAAIKEPQQCALKVPSGADIHHVQHGLPKLLRALVGRMPHLVRNFALLLGCREHDFDFYHFENLLDIA